MPKQQNKPCVAPKAGPYPCFWFISGLCTAYNPSVKESVSGTRIPDFSPVSSVPQEFCNSHQILRDSIDSWHNRNVISVRYENAGISKKQTKVEEKTIGSSGSITKKGSQKEDDPGSLFV